MSGEEDTNTGLRKYEIVLTQKHGAKRDIQQEMPSICTHLRRVMKNRGKCLLERNGNNDTVYLTTDLPENMVRTCLDQVVTIAQGKDILAIASIEILNMSPSQISSNPSNNLVQITQAEYKALIESAEYGATLASENDQLKDQLETFQTYEMLYLDTKAELEKLKGVNEQLSSITALYLAAKSQLESLGHTAEKGSVAIESEEYKDLVDQIMKLHKERDEALSLSEKYEQRMQGQIIALKKYAEQIEQLSKQASDAQGKAEYETARNQPLVDKVSVLEHDYEKASKELAAKTADNLGFQHALQDARFKEEELRQKLGEADARLGTQQNYYEGVIREKDNAARQLAEEKKSLEDKVATSGVKNIEDVYRAVAGLFLETYISCSDIMQKFFEKNLIGEDAELISKNDIIGYVKKKSGRDFASRDAIDEYIFSSPKSFEESEEYIALNDEIMKDPNMGAFVMLTKKLDDEEKKLGYFIKMKETQEPRIKELTDIAKERYEARKAQEEEKRQAMAQIVEEYHELAGTLSSDMDSTKESLQSIRPVLVFTKDDENYKISMVLPQTDKTRQSYLESMLKKSFTLAIESNLREEDVSYEGMHSQGFTTTTAKVRANDLLDVPKLMDRVRHLLPNTIAEAAAKTDFGRIAKNVPITVLYLELEHLGFNANILYENSAPQQQSPEEPAEPVHAELKPAYVGKTGYIPRSTGKTPEIERRHQTVETMLAELGGRATTQQIINHAEGKLDEKGKSIYNVICNAMIALGKQGLVEKEPTPENQSKLIYVLKNFTPPQPESSSEQTLEPSPVSDAQPASDAEKKLEEAVNALSQRINYTPQVDVSRAPQQIGRLVRQYIELYAVDKKQITPQMIVDEIEKISPELATRKIKKMVYNTMLTLKNSEFLIPHKIPELNKPTFVYALNPEKIKGGNPDGQ